MSQAQRHRTGESSIHYAGWGILAAALVGAMVSFTSIVPYTFSLFLNPLHASFGWKRESMDDAFALAAITVAVVSPLLGLLFDRFPPRRIILPAIRAFALALASLSKRSSALRTCGRSRGYRAFNSRAEVYSAGGYFDNLRCSERR